MIDLSHLVQASNSRLVEAREVADALRHNIALHRLAMKAVFVLEDVHEALVTLQAEAEAEKTQQKRSW